MNTLDAVWKQFVVNTRGSIRVTTAKTTNDVQRQLAGHLGLIEACSALLQPQGSVWEPPLIFEKAVARIRVCIQNGASSDQLNDLVEVTDMIFDGVIRRSDRGNVGPLQIDLLSALGWLARSTLHISAGMTERANECGRHTLDAILRIVILTGHLRSDLTLLMREIGVTI